MRSATRARKPTLSLVVVAALMLLLPLLAYLQYEWLGKVSEREREQRQTALGHMLGQFREDFDREVARIFLQFEVRQDSVDKVAAEYAKVLAHWNSTAPYPGLVRDIFLEEEASGGAERLQRLNVSTGNWETADWLTEFGPRRAVGPPLDGKIPAVVIPIPQMAQMAQMVDFARNPMPTPPMPIPMVRPMMLVVRLNLDYIRKEFVPALIHLHFGGAIAEYRLRITAAEDGSQVIYSSDPDAPPGESDAQEGFFSMRLPEYRSLMPQVFEFSSADPQAGIRADRVFSVPVVQGFVHAFSPGTLAQTQDAMWRIAAAHRSGSLDAAVSQVRRRNLALSFSILFLLALSSALLLVSTNRAQRLARQQMEFVSTISHELRTPLAVICSAGENLADGVVRDPDQLRNYGKVVRNEGRRLTEMVEQVLSFAGIQSGLKRYALVPTDLPLLVDRSISALETPIREKGFTIDRNIAKDVPRVMVDSVSLLRALQNLINNAIKYSGSSRWIGISIFPEGKWVKVSVQDGGSGIASADLPHIFEPFYRGRSAIEAQIQGSGLGLSLVKQTVEGHGGKIEVTSNPAGGSTFCIALPVAS